MVFREHTYGVLVVSSSEKFNSTMKTLLPMTDYWPLDFAGSVSEARRRMLETEYDLVLINAPLPDDFGTRLATSICNETGLGVLLFVKAAMYDDVCSKVTEYGVLTVSKPAPLQVVRPVAERALRHAGAAAPAWRRAQASVEEKIEEIRLVNRAKWLLIERARHDGG